MSKPQALVLWKRENKVGTVELNCVPPNARFANAITPVMYGPSKKCFPAKVILVSNDEEELERKAIEVELELERQSQQAAPVNPKTGRPNRKKTGAVKPGSASDRDVANAVGSKPPVPKQLQGAHQSELRSRKEAKATLEKSQDSTDRQVLSRIRRNINFQDDNNDFSQPSTSRIETENAAVESNSDLNDDDETDADESVGLNEGDGENTENHEENCWCGCKPCTLLQKYDKPEYGSFLREISDLFNGNSQSKKEIKFLQLLPIPENVKRVELKLNSGIFISETDKDQLKVDYRNKPSQLAKETLFKLYGKSAFQNVTVTGRGIKGGTYTIPDDVKKAVTGFVNKYVDKEKQMTTSKLVAMINKRAPDWRKQASPKSSKPKEKPKKSKSSGSTTTTSKVISTSPFKVTPTKEQRSIPRSQLASPQRPTVNFPAMLSPGRKSPRMSPAAKSPRNHARLPQQAQVMGPPLSAPRPMTPRSHPHNGPSNSGNGLMDYFTEQAMQGTSSQQWAQQETYFQPWPSESGQSLQELQPWSGSAYYNGGNNNFNPPAYA